MQDLCQFRAVYIVLDMNIALHQCPSALMLTLQKLFAQEGWTIQPLEMVDDRADEAVMIISFGPAPDEGSKMTLHLETDKKIRIGRIIDKIHYYRRMRSSLPETIPYDNWVIDTVRNRLIFRSDYHDKGPITLTEKEAAILISLINAPAHSMTKDALLQDIWGYGRNIETHTLETHIYRLRQKLPDGILRTDENGYSLAAATE